MKFLAAAKSGEARAADADDEQIEADRKNELSKSKSGRLPTRINRWKFVVSHLEVYKLTPSQLGALLDEAVA
jgi:hypothetical protein